MRDRIIKYLRASPDGVWLSALIKAAERAGISEEAVRKELDVMMDDRRLDTFEPRLTMPRRQFYRWVDVEPEVVEKIKKDIQWFYDL